MSHGKTPPEQPAADERVLERVEGVHHWLELAGQSIHGLGTFLLMWRKFGLRWAIPLIIAISAPVGGYSTLLYTTAKVIPDWVGDFGVRFEARDWDVHLFSLSTVAHDVTVRRDERSSPVFTATEVEFDGSLGTLFKGLFSPGGYYNEITIRHGELHLEQSLTGDWNWQEFLEAVPAARREQAMSGLYSIHGLHLEDVKVVYTEHVPGNSGGGVIETAQATIYVDDINGSLSDLRRAERPDEQPTRIQLKARSADGVIELKGDAALFGSTTGGGTASSVGLLDSLVGAPVLAAAPVAFSGPAFAIRVYLENIGAGAIARMVPTTRVMPVKGTVRGNVEVRRTSGGFSCVSTVQAEDVQLAPNPKLVPARDQYERLRRDLIDYRMSGPFDACGTPERPSGPPSDRDHTVSAMLASFNRQTTRAAPLSVRTLTAFDEQALAGMANGLILGAVTGQLGPQVDREVARMLGGQVTSAGSARPATPTPAPTGKSGNPVTGGVKSLGKGLKRVFGSK